MTCPNCGKPLKEGELYCEYCGCEIEIVSDIDMDLEMDKTIKSIARKEFDYSEDFDEDDDPSIIGMIVKSGHKIGKLFYVLLGLVALTVVFVAVHLGRKISHESSLEYQIEMAEKAYKNNDYSKAVSYLNKAMRLDTKNGDYALTIADYYMALGNETDATLILSEAAENEEYDEVKRVKAYRKLFEIYKNNANYSAIAERLNNCTLESVLTDFSQYIVDTPVFNKESGTYNESIFLSINNDSDSKILYTLDGSNPVDNGTEYTTPLLLEYGSYTIKAVCMNDYGICSETVSGTYLIDVAFSFSPNVEPEEGEFEHSFMIEVDVPVMYTCYYTLDGSDPTKESFKYTEPIPAMLGTNTYKFVVFSNDGTASEIVTKVYTVNLDTEITPADAVTMLNRGLIDRGYLDESGCHREGIDGTYIFMYSTIYPIEGMGDFYFVVEYIQDAFGNNTMTGTYYAIDCYNGMLYSVDVTGEDGYKLSPL